MTNKDKPIIRSMTHGVLAHYLSISLISSAHDFGDTLQSLRPLVGKIELILMGGAG